jgi:hypothetical protein
MKPGKNGGYLRVMLHFKNPTTQKTSRQSQLIHRLVAKAFLENSENKLTVNHIDHDPSNNLVDNLEWATIQEQNKHSRKSKTHKNARKVFKLDLVTNSVIRVYRSSLEAAQSFGLVSLNCKRSCIIAVCNNKRKTAYGYKWRYDTSGNEDLPNEQWKEITGHPGYYISSCGRYRKGVTGDAKTGHQRLSGYVKMGIKETTYSVHRLVAQTFIHNPQPEVLTIVNHKNGIRNDNSVDNLEWVTHSENCQHAHDTGLYKRRKRKFEMYDKSGKLVDTFESQKKAAKTVGVSASCINSCLYGRSKSSGGFIFKFQEEESSATDNTSTV